MIGVLLNLILFVIKYIGGMLSGAISVTADAFNNLTDAVTMCLAAIGLSIASCGPGKKHRNGHGRFEWIMAMLTSVSVFIVGWELLQSSIKAIRSANELSIHWFTFVALIISIGVKLFLYIYNTKKAKQQNLETLKSIALDSITDAIETTAVLLAMVIFAIWNVNLDGVFGVAVSIFIMYNSIQAFSAVVVRILGPEAQKEELDKLEQFVLCDDAVKAVYDLQIEDFGFGRSKAYMSVAVNDSMDGKEIILHITKLTYEVYKTFGYSVTIQPEWEADQEEVSEVTKQIERELKQSPVEMKVEQVRIGHAEGKNIIRLTVLLWFEDRNNEKLATSYLLEKLKIQNEGYEILPQVLIGKTRRNTRRSRKRHA